MAPEQFDQDGEYTSKTEIYQMGFIFFELLMGKHPEDKEFNKYSNLREKLALKNVSSEVVSVIEKCLEEFPENRYDWP